MAFQSLSFILAVVVAATVFHYCSRDIVKKVLLFVFSMAFYASVEPRWSFCLAAQIVFNYYLFLRPAVVLGRRSLIAAVALNLLPLLYFKYWGFLDHLLGGAGSVAAYRSVDVIIPLALSFYTFEIISSLVDKFRSNNRIGSLLDYSLFLVFFPKMAAGPIVRLNDVLTRSGSFRLKRMTPLRMNLAVTLLLTGLLKKMLVAQRISLLVDASYRNVEHLTSLEALLTAVLYSFQIYFDFSGYVDIALAFGLFFGLKLPDNFNRPYLAANIQEFWRRWHITLSAWIRDYIYIPLGGNKGGSLLKWRNLLIAFLLTGLWHGANYTFIVWGLLHGAAIGIVHLMRERSISMPLPRFLKVALTFSFVTVTWIFFRSDNLEQASLLLQKIVSMNVFAAGLPTFTAGIATLPNMLLLSAAVVTGVLMVFFDRTWFFIRSRWASGVYAVAASWIIFLLFSLRDTEYSRFIYFSF